jgi:hypothetical protein
LAIVAERKGRAGTAAIAILLLVMIVALIAGLLEPALRRARMGQVPGTVGAGILGLSVISMTLAVVVMVSCSRQLRSRLLHHRAALG